MGESIFFIAKGECEVLVRNRHDEENLAAILYAGAHFGEISLLYNTPRTATVKALNYCTVAKMKNKYFDMLIK